MSLRQLCLLLFCTMSVPVLAADPATVKVKDITLTVPGSWKQTPPMSGLRLAQFAVPKVGDDPTDAEMVVSFFEGDGGGIDPNLKRWEGQFAADGRTVKRTTGESPQGKYYISDISGTFNQPVGPPIAGRTRAVPGSRSISVILVVAGKGNYFLKLTGPDKTVAAAADALRQSFGAEASKETEYTAK